MYDVFLFQYNATWGGKWNSKQTSISLKKRKLALAPTPAWETAGETERHYVRVSLSCELNYVYLESV